MKYQCIYTGTGKCEVVVTETGAVHKLDFGAMMGGTYILEAILEAAYAAGKYDGFRECRLMGASDETRAEVAE
jgi:hypothetical protein